MTGIPGPSPAGDLSVVFPGAGDVAADLRRFDWTQTPLGPPSTWSRALASAVRIMLSSRFSMWMAWGDELTFFCNDAYRRDTLGVKYPWALGRSAREVWSEIWDDIGPRIDSVLRTGVATWDSALMLFLERSGYREETYHTFSYSPLFDDDGATAGMLCVVVEETERVLGERRLATLGELSAGLAAGETEDDVYATVRGVFALHDRDLPFLRIYDAAGRDRLRSESPFPDALDDRLFTLARRALPNAGEPVRLARDSAPGIPTGSWDTAGDAVVVLPLGTSAMARADGAAEAWLVAGLNPYRPADETAAFARLVARQISASLGTAHAFEAERRRAAELEALDRAKTQFFSNVSHEFRTPLTLMMGPLETLRARFAGRDEPDVVRELDVATRNGARLSKLVNSLLDFSRIQAGRVDALFERIDVAALTEELAGAFRTVIEHAGLELLLWIEPVDAPVYLDRNMWERIVLNLMSNAVKYTFEGSITVRLRQDGDVVVLSVADTGVGIGAEDLPKVFERFHRVQHTHARSAEGSGIGLALVAELVSVHGGTIDAESSLGRGSTFSVRVPIGRGHLPHDRVVESTTTSAPSAVDSFVAESLGWIAPANVAAAPASALVLPHEVLIADDNADMRGYLERVLAEHFRTRTVRDGAEALTAIRESKPDLVVSDIMMPNVDGLELVRRLRADEALADLPVMLLTAQAASSAELQGINVGADDYLVKPFSADDLVARARARIAASAERRRRNRLSVLAERLLRSDDVATMVNEAHAVLEEWFRCDHTTLAVVDDDRIHVRLWHHPAPGLGVAERYFRIRVDAAVPACAAIRECAPAVIESVDDVRRDFPAVLDEYRTTSADATVSMPLVPPSGEPSGSLTATWFAPRTFSADDLSWFAKVAAHVADALERRRVARRDHEVLQAFQEQQLTIDHRALVGMTAARYRPAARELLVGGDWYDVSTRADGALRLSIGDVVGKGLSAARVMTQLRSALGTAGSLVDEPSDVVATVDQYARQLNGALCATVVYMILEPNGTVRWSTAGHPPPLVANGDTVRFLDDGRRPPLAARPTLDHVDSAVTHLPDCALLLLYTDGLVERRREEPQVGAARLAIAVRDLGHLPLDEFLDALVERMAPPGDYGDDVALLAVRVAGAREDHFVHVFHASPVELRVNRSRLRDWLDERDVDPEIRDDVILAVGEATANACEHGSRLDERAVVGVEVSLHDDILRVAVTDHGQWDGDSSRSSRLGRGRGFLIMQHLMDGLDIRRGPLGTTVSMHRRVQHASAAPVA